MYSHWRWLRNGFTDFGSSRIQVSSGSWEDVVFYALMRFSSLWVYSDFHRSSSVLNRRFGAGCPIKLPRLPLHALYQMRRTLQETHRLISRLIQIQYTTRIQKRRAGRGLTGELCGRCAWCSWFTGRWSKSRGALTKDSSNIGSYIVVGASLVHVVDTKRSNLQSPTRWQYSCILYDR